MTGVIYKVVCNDWNECGLILNIWGGHISINGVICKSGPMFWGDL
jgi:hypothetical protein